ncbi:molybdopterin-dependent oxidoreductase [Nannocystis sp.]|uniref:molybdopterin-dependent oxidoreductase n=1 Tax=Nannocystis sp. TaxID=1962667 RepID=UPI0025F09157|nr:molybdopterin-dependent oxidoreductase [Nannocystis sp.]MBK7828851.1 molybdopterin-dependent oxidoreductase [Nannocystis sp.]
MFVRRRPRHAALLAGLLACSLVGACAGDGPPARVELQLADGAHTLTREQLAELPELSVTYKDRNYTGVRLRDLLAAQRQELTALVATAVDGYSQELSIEAVARDDAMLAYAVDGGHLTAADGPLRLVVPSSPGLSVKQLVRLARP